MKAANPLLSSMKQVLLASLQDVRALSEAVAAYCQDMMASGGKRYLLSVLMTSAPEITWTTRFLDDIMKVLHKTIASLRVIYDLDET